MWRSLDRRGAAVAWTGLALAPVPIALAILLTAEPSYPADACYYGAPPASLRETHDYLARMAALGMAGFAVAASVAARLHTRRWRLVAAGLWAWAAVSALWQEASHPLMYPGGLLALFAIFLTPPLVVITIAAAVRGSWLRAVAWFEALFALPALLGVAKVLAQPACMP